MAISTGAAILGGAGIAAVGGLLGSKSQSRAANQAAQTSADAANYATNNQKDIYDQTRADQTPWREVGANSLQQLAGLTAPNGELMHNFSMADYQADPGYSFRLAEGEKALERSAAARGGLYSGRAMKDMARFSQGLASDEYQNAFNRFQSNQANKFNRLASLAGVGQTANQALQTAGTNYANGAGSAALRAAGDAGSAQLVGGIGRASAYQSIGNMVGRMNLGGVSFGGAPAGGGGGGGGVDYAGIPSNYDWGTMAQAYK